MTGTAELIARVKQAAADLHLVAKLSNKPPLSAAFILNDVAVALAAQAQEIERLNEVWHPSEQAARNAEARAEAAEAKVAEQAREIERLTAEAKDWHDAASALNGDVTELGQRAEAAEARADIAETPSKPRRSSGALQ
jgi:predicted  nucleic acid-binding Zn-ribbon protein